MSKTIQIEFDENKYCTAFDYAANNGYESFIKLITLSCMTPTAVKRSLIVPTKEEIKRIAKIDNKTERLLATSYYILSSPISMTKMKEYMEKGTENFKLWTLLGHKTYYTPTKDGEDIKLNGVKIKVIKEWPTSTLYEATGPLEPTKSEGDVPVMPKKGKDDEVKAMEGPDNEKEEEEEGEEEPIIEEEELGETDEPNEDFVIETKTIVGTKCPPEEELKAMQGTKKSQHSSKMSRNMNKLIL